MAKGIFHRHGNQPYRFENSFRGILHAVRHGYRRIDLDVQMTKDGVLVNTHWARPMLKDTFFDPKHRLKNKHLTVNQMTWEQVQRLQSKGGYKIRTLNAALKYCAEHGLGATIEPKTDAPLNRFEKKETWVPVKAFADSVGCDLRGYSIRNYGGKNAGVRRVNAMRAAGIPAVPIR